jgi:hypothetical protein
MKQLNDEDRLSANWTSTLLQGDYVYSEQVCFTIIHTFHVCLASSVASDTRIVTVLRILARNIDIVFEEFPLLGYDAV